MWQTENAADTPETCALLIAHPGHELRVHHWLERARPRVFVLTDGSGSDGRDRLDSTRAVLCAANAREGEIFGPWTDRRAYELLFERDLEVVQAVIACLATSLVNKRVSLVASDAIEGFNPSHDLCSVIAECAVTRARRQSNRPIRHLDFLLEAAPAAQPSGDSVHLQLDDDAWKRKLESARAYEELQAEVDRAMNAHTPSAFRREVLRPVPPDRDLGALIASFSEAGVPTYEIVGQDRVQRGIYDRVLRFREHWLPFAEALRAWARA